MSEEYVWVTDIHSDSRLFKGFDSDLLLENQDLVIDMINRHKKGEVVQADEYPKVMWAGVNNAKLRKAPHLFLASGFWAVSKEFADVLCQFDLGKTELHPVELYQRDKKTHLEGSHAFLGCCEIKAGFEKEYSDRYREPFIREPPFIKLHTVPKDFDISVNSSVLVGPDLWYDSTLNFSFFLSDRLVRALKAAKLTGHMSLYKARVITNN